MGSKAARIVSLLKAGETDVSGQFIADRLGVTRAAVSKSIAGLRQAGFRIDSSTKRGYTLREIPDVPSGEVLTSLLDTSFMGRTVEYHKTIDSTNGRAMKLGYMGEPEGTVVTADSQTGGKAKHGEKWVSPPGNNLYLSVILKPDIPVGRTHEIENLVLGALAELVRELVPEISLQEREAGLWCSRGKLGGVLCEVCGELDQIHHLVAGIGLSVSHGSASSQSVSLTELTGRDYSRAELTASLLGKLERGYTEWRENDQG